jgi:hypothetical protein
MDIGVTTLGGEAVGFHCAIAVEASYNHGEDEKVVGEMHSLASFHYHPDPSYGSDTETQVNAG